MSAMNNNRRTRGQKLVALVPLLWLVVFFLIPFLFVLKISLSHTAIAQPPYVPVFDPAQGFDGLKRFLRALSFDNFAFIGLHEAYAATGDPRWKKAEDQLAGFLVRAQVQSAAHPELSGAWFRAFDFQSWDYWASNSDSGWGAWCTETGWSQSWITSTFALRRLSRSLWDVISTAPAYPGFPQLAKSMFPE